MRLEIECLLLKFKVETAGMSPSRSNSPLDISQSQAD
jgi:hypothetical protein